MGFEEGLSQLRANVPVPLQGIDIGAGDAALQVAFDVLDVLGLLAVDVAREIEVEIVLLDLLDADHAGVFRDFEPPVEDIDDPVDVLGAEAVLGAVLHDSLRWRRS